MEAFGGANDDEARSGEWSCRLFNNSHAVVRGGRWDLVPNPDTGRPDEILPVWVHYR